MNLQFPKMVRQTVTIDPDDTTQYKIVRSKPYLLIDMVAPEVDQSLLESVKRANLTTYEQAVNRFQSSMFVFDAMEFTQAEPRLVKNLNSLVGKIDPGHAYLISFIILEF